MIFDESLLYVILCKLLNYPALCVLHCRKGNIVGGSPDMKRSFREDILDKDRFVITLELVPGAESTGRAVEKVMVRLTGGAMPSSMDGPTPS